MFFAGANQPRSEGAWLNSVMAHMLVLCLIIEYNGTTFQGMNPEKMVDSLQAVPSFLFRVFAVCILFVFVSLMDGHPRWANKVQLRQDADIGVRLGSITLPALFLLSHHHFFWTTF